MQALGAAEGAFPRWAATVTELPAAPQEPRIRAQHAAAKIALGYPAVVSAGPVASLA